MHLAYIDDVVDALLNLLEGKAEYDGDYCIVPTTHHTTLGEIVDLLESFKESRKNLELPEMQGLAKNCMPHIFPTFPRKMLFIP